VAKLLSFLTVPLNKISFGTNRKLLGSEFQRAAPKSKLPFCQQIKSLAADTWYSKHAYIMPFTVYWTAQDNHIFSLLRRTDGSYRLLQGYISSSLQTGYNLDEFLAKGSEHVDGCSTDIDSFCADVETLTATDAKFDVKLFNKLFNYKGAEPTRNDLEKRWGAEALESTVAWKIFGPTFNRETHKKGVRPFAIYGANDGGAKNKGKTAGLVKDELDKLLAEVDVSYVPEAAQRFKRLRSTIAATGPAGTTTAEKACPAACTNGQLCCANLPADAPQWQESGYLGRCISRGSFSEAQCKDVGGKIPAGQEEYKFAANGVKCAAKAKGQECSWNKPCCGATEWPRTAEAAAQGKKANNKFGYSDGIHYDDYFLECKYNVPKRWQVPKGKCTTTKKCKPVNAACKWQAIGSKCCSGKCVDGHCADE
jgi:hypothetical protein